MPIIRELDYNIVTPLRYSNSALKQERFMGLKSSRCSLFVSSLLTFVLMVGTLNAIVFVPRAFAAPSIFQQNEPGLVALNGDGNARGRNDLYQLKAPTVGTWDLVGAWNFNNATDFDVNNAAYNTNCSGANNNDGTYGPIANTWGGLQFNALSGYTNGYSSDLVNRSGVNSRIRLAASVTGSTSSGCMGVYEVTDYYGGKVNTYATGRRTTETIDGASYVYPENYFIISKSPTAVWTNTFSNLDPNKKYRFQFVYSSLGNLHEQVKSVASIAGSADAQASQDLSLTVTGPQRHKNRITVELSSATSYSLIRTSLNNNINDGYQVLNAFTIYEERKTPSSVTYTASTTNPLIGTDVVFEGTVTSGATGTISFKDSLGNVLCTTGNIASDKASCTWRVSAPGSKTVQAEYSGSAIYASSLSTTTNITVDRASTVTSITCNDTVYNGSPKTPCSALVTGAGGLSESVSVTYSNNTSAGTATANATFAGNANYDSSNATPVNFTISKATPTFTWSGSVKNYKGPNFQITPPVSAVAGTFSYGSGSTSVISLTGDTATIGQAGSSVITATFTPTDIANYFSALTTTMTVQVNRAPLTVTASSPTVTYGAAAPAIAPTFSAFAGADTDAVITGLSCSSPTYTTTSAVGTNPATTCSGGIATNYLLSYVNGSVTIIKSSQANNLILTSTSGTYGTDLALTASGGSGGGALTFATNTAGCSFPTSTTLRATGAMTCAVTVTRAADSNFDASSSTSTNVVFGAKNLTISGLTGVNKVYSGDRTSQIPTGTATLVGVINNDDVSLTGSPTFTFDSASVGISKNVSATGFSLTGVNAGKYSLTQPSVSADIKATVTYSSEGVPGVVPIDTKTYDAGAVVVVKGNTGSLTRPGYSFAGWTEAQDVNLTLLTSGSTYVIQSRSITFIAKWVANTYTITYNANGALPPELTSSDTYTTSGTAVTLPGVGTMVRPGYDFGGWSEAPLGSAVTSPYTTAANVTLYALWNIKSYAVNFSKGAASAETFFNFPITRNANYGSFITLDDAVDSAVTISGESYAFMGWNDGISVYQSGATYFVGSSSPTFTAVWVKIYAVRYAFNGGTAAVGSSAIDSECVLGGNTCTNGQIIRANTAPNKIGYTFTGWSDQSGLQVTAGDLFTVSATRYLIYAGWSAIDYLISYDSDGGSVAPTSFTKHYGESFTLGAAPTKVGYTFAGWFDGSQTYGAGSYYQTSSSAVTFVARWRADIYTVVYDWNGGSGSSTSNSLWSVGTAALTLPSVGDHIKDGFTFAGWSTSSTGLLISGGYTPSVPSIGEITLYAIWGAGSYSLLFDANGGTVLPTSLLVLNGSNLNLPTPVRSQFVFEGWYTAVNSGTLIGAAGANYQPTSSSSLYAKWTQASLYGINPTALRRVGTTTARDAGTVNFSVINANSAVSVTIPAQALPDGTVINFDLVDDTTRAQSILGSSNTYIISMIVSWLSPTNTVPDTTANNPISMTITNDTIKAGMSIYSIVNGAATLLATATQDRVVTVSITTDPEIIVVATKPSAPSNLTATVNVNSEFIFSWNAPANGGSSITNYTVTSNTGASCVSISLTCTIAGLTPGVIYTFSVIATNANGNSNPSSTITATARVIEPTLVTPEPTRNIPSAPPTPVVVNQIEIETTPEKETSVTVQFVKTQDKPQSRFYITVENKLGKKTSIVEKSAGDNFEIVDGLTPGLVNLVTVTNESGVLLKSSRISVPPLKVWNLSAIAATKATQYAFIIKWNPNSYSEYYQITVQPSGGEKLTYLSSTPDFYLFDRKAQKYEFTIAAQGEDGTVSEPIAFKASLTAPISLIGKFNINAKSSKFTTKSIGGLRAIGTRSDQAATVTVSTYFDSKVKGSKQRAKLRAINAGTVIKATRPTVTVKISVTKAVSKAQLGQMGVLSKAPPRKLVLSKV